MNGMKGIFLTLAVIASVVLAVPTNPLGRDVAAPAPAAVSGAPIPATVEGSPKVEPKPATNTTPQPAAAPKLSASEAPIPAVKSEDRELEFELPISDESEAERVYEARGSSEDSNAEELVGAAKSEQFAEEMQGDEAAPSAFEKNQGARQGADAKAAGDAQVKPAEKVEAPKQADKAEEAKGAVLAVKAEEAEEEEAEEDEDDEEAKQSEVTFVARVAEVARGAVGADKIEDSKKVGEVEKAEDDGKAVVAKAVGVAEAKKEEDSKGATVAAKEVKGAETGVGRPQTPSADFQREKMIDEMIEKLMKLKDVTQAN